ncbi:MAG: DNA topoisomerase IV subunit A [Geminicoccaceae bacterium]|nr:MAG: DNA topoisomerase IV subunit A [Geminicoccaceae bacterium]
MAAKPDSDEKPGEIRPVDLRDALSQRYLAYALSTITSRSLPDVRDGLKPVQRRLLYAMRELRLDADGAYKKCARIVGDVIGKFHPHGDTAVYDALVRLAQDFTQRYPLVDGQGNFGNVDGDNAAAMRYTESRLTDVAMALLDQLDEDTVDFRATYDGSETEPVVLPAAFPNLLANGASGIAVGMATSIPPHHVGELAEALLVRLADPDAPEAKVLACIQGPDFPTGGVLVEDRDAIETAYRTGRGSFRLRAHWQKEDQGYGQYQIVVDQVPYQVPKSRLVERIAELLAAKKLTLLGDVRDESAEDVRLVLVPRSRTVPPELLMEQLFRLTELEVRVPLNLNVLDAAGVPRVMPLAEALDAFLAHRMVVLIRRSEFRLAKIDDRLEVLDGYLKAFLDIDRVIAIIRENDHPKPVLMAEFELSERQAEAILNLRLRQLRKLEEMALQAERDALLAEEAGLKALLADETLRRQKLADEVRDIQTRFGAEPRRTQVNGAPAPVDLDVEDHIERQPVTVVCSQEGWLRAVRGSVTNADELKFKEGDGPRFLLPAQSTDKLLVLRNDGRCHLVPIDKLPGGRSQGEPLSLYVDLEPTTKIVDVRVHRPDGKLILATKAGYGFAAKEKDIAAATRAGKQVVNLSGKDSLVKVAPLTGPHVAVLGTNRKLLVFAADELPEMSRGKGVILQRYKDGTLDDLKSLDASQGLGWSQGSRRRAERDLSPWQAKRATAGRMVPVGFPRESGLADIGPAEVVEGAGK